MKAKTIEELREEYDNLSDKQKAEATIKFMNLFRQMLNDAKYSSSDEIGLKEHIIDNINKIELKSKEYLNK